MVALAYEKSKITRTTTTTTTNGILLASQHQNKKRITYFAISLCSFRKWHIRLSIFYKTTTTTTTIIHQTNKQTTETTNQQTFALLLAIGAERVGNVRITFTAIRRH
jgi:hypothetical protein